MRKAPGSIIPVNNFQITELAKTLQDCYRSGIKWSNDPSSRGERTKIPFFLLVGFPGVWVVGWEGVELSWDLLDPELPPLTSLDDMGLDSSHQDMPAPSFLSFFFF